MSSCFFLNLWLSRWTIVRGLQQQRSEWGSPHLFDRKGQRSVVWGKKPWGVLGQRIVGMRSKTKHILFLKNIDVETTVTCLNWKIKSIFKRLLVVVVNIYDTHMPSVGPCTLLIVWIRDHICIFTLLADSHPSVKLCQNSSSQNDTLQS